MLGGRLFTPPAAEDRPHGDKDYHGAVFFVYKLGVGSSKTVI